MKKKIKKYISGSIVAALLLTIIPLQEVTGMELYNDGNVIESENEVFSNDSVEIENDFEVTSSSKDLLAEDTVKSDNIVGRTVSQNTVSDAHIAPNAVLETEEVVENDMASRSADTGNKGFKKIYYIREIGVGYSNELQFDIPRSGRLRFVFNNCENPDYYVSCLYIPSYIHIPFTITNKEETAYTNWCTVLPGTIEAHIESETSVNAEATLCVEYQPGGSYVGEVEENDSFDTANKLPVNTTFWGAENNNDDFDKDLDYFYFNVNAPSKMKLVTKNLDSILAVGFGAATDRIKLYKETKYGNIEYITSLLYYKKCFLPAMRLSPGKYFLVVNPKYIGTYSIYVGLKKESNKSYEQEDNNLSSKANKKNVNKWYTGNVNIYMKEDAYEYDKDWYQFKVAKKSYIQMELRTPRQAEGTVIANLYNSSKKTIASIESTENPYSKTKKRMVNAGTYYIRVTSNDTYLGFNQVDWDYKIRLTQKAIAKKSQSLTVNKKSLEFYAKGNAKKLKVFNAKGNITYKSNNPQVAKVNASGRVVPKKAGKTTIIVKASGNSSYKPATIKVKVTVKERKK